MSKARRTILASHLAFMGYGHWFPNDPRGSGSSSIRKDELKDLGEILSGRQYPQPLRDEVREFYQQADNLLEHDRIWFSGDARNVIAQAVGEAATKFGYTIWELAICSNHMHAVVRAHRHRSESIWDNTASATMLALRETKLFPVNHPVWSARPYKVFLHDPKRVVDCIDYVRKNPLKEGLPQQRWECVKECLYRAHEEVIAKRKHR